MSDTRRKNVSWNVTDDHGQVITWDQVHAALLMDIRDELQKLNAVFACHNFQQVPNILRKIRGNTSRIPGVKK